MTVKAEIAVEMYKAAEHLGAKSDLLRIIGSYGDTMPDEWVRDALSEWNARRARTACDVDQHPSAPGESALRYAPSRGAT
jgi:hypothetical protein